MEPQIISAATLQSKAFKPTRFVAAPFIPEGATLLAGRPKVGKSWLALDVALAVASGSVCFGKQCEAGDVLYLALEDNERRLQSRINKLLGTQTRNWPSRLHLATSYDRADRGGLDHLRSWINSAVTPRLIVVDVLAAFRPTKRSAEDSYSADYAAIQSLQQIASEHVLGVLIVHHLRKSVGESDPFEKVSGTLGLSGAADTVLVLDRNAQGHTIYGRGRDIEEIEEAVEFDAAACRWRLLGSASEVHRTDERKAVLAALKIASKPMNAKELSEELNISAGNARQLLSRMAQAGEVKKVGRGLYAYPSLPL